MRTASTGGGFGRRPWLALAQSDDRKGQETEQAVSGAQTMTKRRRVARAAIALSLLALGAGLVAAGFPGGEGAHGPDLAEGEGGATKPTPRLWIKVEPGSRSVAPGLSATYQVRIHHRGDGPVSLRMVRGLPKGATASVSPQKTRRSKATLTIRTAAATPAGTYRPGLRARGGVRHANISLRLIVATPPNQSFEIGGAISEPLEPGLAVALDLTLSNPDPEDILITDLRVSISQVSAPLADQAHPCSADDFSVTQFSAEYPLALEGEESSSLSGLGLAEGEWPQVSMLDLPVNQDGCKEASLAFEFTGTSRSGSPQSPGSS
jgi:hypothetical protein